MEVTWSALYVLFWIIFDLLTKKLPRSPIVWNVKVWNTALIRLNTPKANQQLRITFNDLGIFNNLISTAVNLEAFKRSSETVITIIKLFNVNVILHCSGNFQSRRFKMINYECFFCRNCIHMTNTSLASQWTGFGTAYTGQVEKRGK